MLHIPKDKESILYKEQGRLSVWTKYITYSIFESHFNPLLQYKSSLEILFQIGYFSKNASYVQTHF